MLPLPSVLLVDADPKSRDALAFGFEREGCAVHAWGDADEALQAAAANLPGLVVVSSDPEGVDAVAFARRLRATRAVCELPLLVLGEEAMREWAMDAGADEYIVRPAFLRDVVTLGRLAVAVYGEGDGGGWVGSLLDTGGLFFLARALFAARRSAELVLDHGERRAELSFRAGEVIAARIGRQTGASAFLHLLLWDDADLELRIGEPEGGGEGEEAARRMNTPLVRLPLVRLLAEGLRFVAEFEAAAGEVGGKHAIYRQDRRRLDEVVGQIPAEVVPLVERFDGERTLLDMVDESPFWPLDTILITRRLAGLGVIARVGPARAEPAPVPPNLRAWLDEKRPAPSPPVEDPPAEANVQLAPPAVTAVKVEPRPAAATPAAAPQPRAASVAMGLTSEGATAPIAAPGPVAATPASRPALAPKPAPAAPVPKPALAAPAPRPVAAAAAPKPAAAAPAPRPAAAAPAPRPAAAAPAPRPATPAQPPAEAAPSAPAPPSDSGRQAFDDLDHDFFAREEEHLQVDVDINFDDLDAPAAAAARAAKKPPVKPTKPVKRGWFDFGRSAARPKAKPAAKPGAGPRPPAAKK